jgi:hypothetical protein
MVIAGPDATHLALPGTSRRKETRKVNSHDLSLLSSQGSPNRECRSRAVIERDG